MTAKPTIWAQHPATAAPPARPTRPRAAQMAALEMGSVRAIPTITDTRIPMKKGCSSVAHMIRSPVRPAAVPMAGAHQREKKMPTRIVTRGVARISMRVSFEMAFPHSAARTVMIRTASGPPAAPSSLAAAPTDTRENKTSCGA